MILKKETKQKMIAAYRERQIIGGAYTIINTRSGKKFLDVTTDIGVWGATEQEIHIRL